MRATRYVLLQFHSASPSSRALASLAVVALVFFAAAGGACAADPPAVEGDPFRGREVFQAKGCSRCHSVWGHGGTLGPEITVVVVGKTWDELVGDFWNHTPQMIDQVAKLGYPWPTLDVAEMSDILSYLYYLRLFDEPGNAARGADTYARLQCVACHTLGAHGPASGVALDRFGAYPSPTALAQAMWNAGPRMQQEQMRHGTAIPQFGAHDMSDLQAYIRAEGRRARSSPPTGARSASPTARRAATRSSRTSGSSGWVAAYSSAARSWRNW